jgi:hypothetical protein
VGLQTGQQTVAGLLCIACRKNTYFKKASLLKYLKAKQKRPEKYGSVLFHAQASSILLWKP